MLKAKIAKEVVIRMHNEVGALATLTKLIAEKGINILACSAWVTGREGEIHLVTDDNLRVVDALTGKRYAPREQEVILTEVPHRAGLLRHLTGELAAAGIDIRYLYGSATSSQDLCLIVLSSSDNDRAMVRLNS